MTIDKNSVESMTFCINKLPNVATKYSNLALKIRVCNTDDDYLTTLTTSCVIFFRHQFW